MHLSPHSRRIPLQRIALQAIRRSCAAVIERFFWSLKQEWAQFGACADIEAARLSEFRYVETVYNTQGIH
jgi:hypothetical protein